MRTPGRDAVCIDEIQTKEGQGGLKALLLVPVTPSELRPEY